MVKFLDELSEEQVEGAQQEARMLSKIVHPNIIRVRDFFESDREVCSVYDFIPDGNLSDIIN